MELGNGDSNFYMLYPCKAAGNGVDVKRNGHFEDLSMYCGWGYDEENEKNGALTDVDDGLFQWSKEVLANLNAMNFAALA